MRKYFYAAFVTVLLCALIIGALLITEEKPMSRTALDIVVTEVASPSTLIQPQVQVVSQDSFIYSNAGSSSCPPSVHSVILDSESPDTLIVVWEDHAGMFCTADIVGLQENVHIQDTLKLNKPLEEYRFTFMRVSQQS